MLRLSVSAAFAAVTGLRAVTCGWRNGNECVFHASLPSPHAGVNNYAESVQALLPKHYTSGELDQQVLYMLGGWITCP